ncbi:MAG: protein kinase [Deltaproteobacteria bacterium]|nr:protein kinase [Deltaproteobacteria bacterium]
MRELGPPVNEEFRGTARFSVRKRIGSGGMGVVYHAYDRQRGLDVALKTLRFADATAIYRLKKEFRSLAGVSHPNLVTLHELVNEGDLWFFTMELVRGSSFIDYVTRPDEEEHNTMDVARAPKTKLLVEDEITEVSTTVSTAKHTLKSMARMVPLSPLPIPQQEGIRPNLNLPRLYSSLRQLVDGLSALHRSGLLHRDIKPSNVLVTRSGRVVILDFGVALEVATNLKESSSGASSAGLAGTFAYMAPEQGTEETLSSAADWYSVGVMLFEALTGQLPFPGAGLDVLVRKNREAAPAPSSFVSGVPADLETLCSELLDRDPDRRPSGAAILERLGGAKSQSSISSFGLSEDPDQVPGKGGPFIGRNRHLASLDEAFAASKNRPVALYVRGDSGIGKTTLVKQFLHDLRRREDVVVFSGRCYERENVPFKALDSSIDALSRYLSRLPKDEINLFIPRGVRALARLFPVLERVEAVARAPRLPAQTPDQQELRRRAFRALKDLLARIAADRPVVLFIDDLQWSDTDSAALLIDLFGPPDPPPLLLIACFRSEDEATSPALLEVLRARLAPETEVRSLTVGALSDAEAVDLALTHLARSDDAAQRRAEEIAHEAAGSPFFVDVLARYARKESVTQGSDPEIRLDAIFERRLAKLAEPARRLLEVVAVAGRPIERDVAAWAAELSARDESGVLEALRAAHLVRTAQTSGSEILETYHDRIRAAVNRGLGKEKLAERHRDLARALEARRRDDHEALFFHYKESGDDRAAGQHAAAAGDQAARSLAFDRAAALYRTALPLERDLSSRRELSIKLASALANAGRGAEAARIYLDSARTADRDRSIELKRHAMEQYLLSGHVDTGLAVLDQVLEAVEMKVPRTTKGAFASRMLKQAQLWKKGLSFTERPPESQDKETLLRVDILWGAATGLGLVDFLRGADFQARHILEAINAGDPYRFVRAVAMEATYAGAAGSKSEKRALELISMAEETASRLQHPHAMALVAVSRGATSFLSGRWTDAMTQLDRADHQLRDTCTGAFWELALARIFFHGALYFLGKISELSRFVNYHMDEAEIRGDLLQSTSHRIGHSNFVWLAADNPERARRLVDEAMGRWSHSGYHLQHCLALLARARSCIYLGRGTEAFEVVEAEATRLKSSMLTRTQFLRVDVAAARARAALAAAEEGGDVGDLISVAAFEADQLDDERVRWADGLAALTRAGISILKRRDAEALESLERAERIFEETQMALYASVCRFRRGELLGGDAGRALVTAAAEWMRGQAIKNPRLITQVFLPSIHR